MNISIYQINETRDENNLMFLPHYQVENNTSEIDSGIYDKVFEGEVNCKTLEDVYDKFNSCNVPGYKGRSLSVSDIVEVIRDEESRYYYCDSMGFCEVQFDKEKCNDLNEEKDKINILLVEVGKKPKNVEVEDSLESFQKIVGGMIEEYTPFDDEVSIICNDEGKIRNLPMNRAIYSNTDPDKIDDIICGDFFLCYAPFQSEKFLSLTNDMIEKYTEIFKYPERFQMKGNKITVEHIKNEHNVPER